MRWILAMMLCVQAAWSQELRAPTLAAASNFGQGVPGGLMEGATALGVRDFRDAVYWDRVEGADGRFRFGRPTTRYPEWLARDGAVMSLTLNNGHPGYDGGATSTSPDAVAAFGRHAAEVIARFPNIDAIEIGNEFNSANFVTGALRDAGLRARAEAQAALTQSVVQQARARRPEVRIIGAGVHSIPTGYLAMVSEAGGFEGVDAIALHPYDTPVDMLDRQIGVMRRLPALSTMPVEITEFGTQIAAEASALLWRGICKGALAGVSRIAWYPLHPRGDGYAPLVTRDGTPTEIGQTFALAQSLVAGRPVEDVSPDAMTPACLFDRRTLVIWGAPRALTIAPDIAVFDAMGVPVSAPIVLDETRPFVLRAERSIDPEKDMSFGPQNIVADTFWQFDYPSEPGVAPRAGFLRLARSPAGEAPLSTRPGQDRPGVPWTPYLGLPTNPGLRLLSQSLLPSGSAAFPEEILHRFTAQEPLEAELSIQLSPAARSLDGITLSVERDGRPLLEWSGKARLDRRLPVTLSAGETVTIAVGPGATARGDVTSYRFTLRRVP